MSTSCWRKTWTAALAAGCLLPAALAQAKELGFDPPDESFADCIHLPTDQRKVLAGIHTRSTQAKQARGWDIEALFTGSGLPGHHPTVAATPRSEDQTASDPLWKKFESFYVEQFQRRALNDLCGNIQLPLKGSIPMPAALAKIGGNAQVPIGIKRSLIHYPNNTLGIVDNSELGISLGYSKGWSFLAKNINLPISISPQASLDGNAYVIRPLGSADSCAQIKKLLNLMDFKTVIDVSTQSLSSMIVAEQWQLPLNLGASGSVGASPNVNIPLGLVTVTLSYGASKQETATVTVFRSSPEQIRLRLRIDRALVTTPGAGIHPSIPILGLAHWPSWMENSSPRWTGKQAPGFLDDQIHNVLLGEINHYLWTTLESAAPKTDGRMMFLEFLIQTNDPKQMQALADFLKGQVSALFLLHKITAHAEHIFTDPQNGDQNEHLNRLKKKYARLGTPTRLAADDYTHEPDKLGQLHARLPLIGEFSTLHARDQHHILIQGQPGTLFIDERSKLASLSAWDVPFFGYLVKRDHLKTAEAYIPLDDHGQAEHPFLIYTKHGGVLRSGEKKVRGMADEANSLLHYLGALGPGTNPDAEIPTAQLFTSTASSSGLRLYRSASFSINLLLKEKCLADIFAAPAEKIIQAFVHTLTGTARRSMDAVLSLATIEKDGSLSYDSRALMQALHLLRDQAAPRILGQIDRLARSAVFLAADILEAGKKNWTGRMTALTDILSGKGRCGLKHEAVMKVLLQLIQKPADGSPVDIYGKFFFTTNKKLGGEEDVMVQGQFQKEQIDEKVRAVLDEESRLQPPSLTHD